MFGPPEKIEGNCNARLYLSDDYGDNSCTVQCNLPQGHVGEHCESFLRGDKPVKITWDFNEDTEG